MAAGKKSEAEMELEYARVAFLKSQGHLPAHIAHLLGHSPGTIADWLKKAKERKYLVEAYSQVDTGVSLDDVAAAIYDEERYGRLHDAIRDFADNIGVSTPRRVVAVWTGPKAGEPGNCENEMELFAKGCAPYLTHLLSSAEIVACSWGRHVQQVIKAIQRLNNLSKGKRVPSKTKFIPVAGTLTNHLDPGIRPTEAAQGLQEAMLSSEEALWFQGIPARIPSVISDPSHQRVIREFIQMSSNYAAIFSTDGLMDKVSAVITGVGESSSLLTPEAAAGDIRDPWARETLQAEGLEPKELAEMTSGNIAGLWIDKEGDPEQQKRVEEINSRWLGISYQQLKNCAKRPINHDEAPERYPGVILVARGKAKLEIVVRALSLGLCSQLFIDHTLADALLERLTEG